MFWPVSRDHQAGNRMINIQSTHLSAPDWYSKTRRCMYNVTLKRAPATIVVVEKQYVFT